MNLEHWRTIPSEREFDFEDFYARIAGELPDNSKCVEVGISNGRSLLFLASELAMRSVTNAHEVTGIDNMAYGVADQCAIVVHNVIEAGIPNVRILAMDSLAASTKFNDWSLDFVFIDSSHQFEYTLAELRLWSHKVKPNGLIGGHDYLLDLTPGVKQAVDEFFELQIEDVDSGNPDVVDFNLQNLVHIEKTRNGCGVWWVRR